MNSLFKGLFGEDQHNSNINISQDSGSVQMQTAQGLVDNTINPILKQDIVSLSHLDERANKLMEKALLVAQKNKQSFIEPTHLLIALLSDREIFHLLEQFSIDIAKLTREVEGSLQDGNFIGIPTLSEQSKQIIETAYTQSKKRGVGFVTPEDLLVALLSANITIVDSLKLQGLDKDKVQEKLIHDPQFNSGKKSVLATYGVDLVEEARQGKLDPISGRDQETDRLIHILLRRTKNNPIVIGEAGVGKTAIVEGLAQLIAAGHVPPELLKKKVIKLEIASLVAGASFRGEFEERLQNVIKEVISGDGQIILFIDEIHSLIGAGESSGSIDASSILKPYLSHGQLQIIGTTTVSEYRQYFEKDRAFSRRFQSILVEEPSEDVSLQMLKVLQVKYEKFHNVTFSNEALIWSVHLSKRYVGERFLPDKAIDLLDEAAAEVKLALANGKRQDNVVKGSDIETIVSRWTGIPITKLTEKESDKLLHLEDFIHQKMINQEHAVSAVCEAVRRGRVGLSSASRPIASFVFLGPTGTGKTELAKNLAEVLFGRPDAMVRLDMSEYMEKHEVAKLIGAPPGYVGYEEGGRLTEAVRLKPYSIVLLDEIEKAHPDVFNILLQVLDDGRLTDNKGNTISFKNTIIIATSNIGSNLIQQSLGASLIQNSDSVDKQVEQQHVEQYTEVKKIVMGELTKFLRVELINRFDEIVIFEPLSQKHMTQIAVLQLEDTKKMLTEQGIHVQVSEAALSQLAKEGYDPSFGARPLRRIIQKSIENPIAVYLINKSLIRGDTITIDYDMSQDKFIFGKAANNVIENTQK